MLSVPEFVSVNKNLSNKESNFSFLIPLAGVDYRDI
jgi:hypothetical protein